MVEIQTMPPESNSNKNIKNSVRPRINEMIID